VGGTSVEDSRGPERSETRSLTRGGSSVSSRVFKVLVWRQGARDLDDVGHPDLNDLGGEGVTEVGVDTVDRLGSDRVVEGPLEGVGVHLLIEAGHHKALHDGDQKLAVIDFQIMLSGDVAHHVTVPEPELVEQAFRVEHDGAGVARICRGGHSELRICGSLGFGLDLAPGD